MNSKRKISVVFRESDFQLCNVPVPKGYPQSQTHAGCALKNGTIYLTTSPYPVIKYSMFITYLRVLLRKLSFGYLCKHLRGEYFENPCLYSCKSGEQGGPVKFKLMQSRPLMEPVDPYYGYPAYNSDPDIYIDQDYTYILNRVFYRTSFSRGCQVIRLYMIKGIVEGYKFKLCSIDLFKETCYPFVSPCLTQYKGNYLLFFLHTDCYNDGNSFEGLRFIEGANISDLKSNEKWNNVIVDSQDYIPWHMSIFSHKDRLYAIVACVKRGIPQRCYQMFGEFEDDLKKLKIYPTPLTDIDSYRGAAYVDENGVFSLYTSTVSYRIKGGNSVDGREILFSKIEFKELLVKLKK